MRVTEVAFGLAWYWTSLGNLYGATAFGGSGFGGTVFELTPVNGPWKFVLLHSLVGGQGPNCSLTIDAAGNLYGTAPQDGGAGLVFSLEAGNGSWTYTDLHDFNVYDGKIHSAAS